MTQLHDLHPALFRRTIINGSLLLCLPFLTIGAVWLQQGRDESAYRTMVAADESFDELSAAQGMDRAFLAYLADSAVVFRPGPVPAKEWIQLHPAPRGFVLHWSPRYGEVSRSGDLGYTIGSYESRFGSGDTARVGYGYYLTVWETDGGGKWKAILDGGVRVKKKLHVGRGVAENRSTKESGNGSLHGLLEYDRTRSSLLAALPLGDALDSLLADDAFLVRDLKGIGPGTNSLARFLEHPDARLRTSVLGGGASSAGDLGFTYGEYRMTEDGQPVGEGYYVRVWRCEEPGRWRIVIDLALPGPVAGD
jgi:ketosteroid isomerase-like protein